MRLQMDWVSMRLTHRRSACSGFCPRRVRIDGQVSGAGTQHAQNRNDHIRRSVMHTATSQSGPPWPAIIASCRLRSPDRHRDLPAGENQGHVPGIWRTASNSSWTQLSLGNSSAVSFENIQHRVISCSGRQSYRRCAAGIFAIAAISVSR